MSGRLRDFEVPACGATYLAQRYPELDVLFQEGRDIEGWSTLEELQYKITYYLNHEAEANALALNAREKVLRDHTWKHRFDLILMIIFSYLSMSMKNVKRKQIDFL